MDGPFNILDLDLAENVAESGDAAYSGAYIANGDEGTAQYFVIPPGKRLGKHHNSAEETQLVLAGTGRVILDAGDREVRAGDVFVIRQGEPHDIENTGAEDLRAIGFFAVDRVEHYWTDEVWPGGKVTKSPNLQ